MIQITFKPISLWPVAHAQFRVRSKFRANYSDTQKLLDRELDRLDAKAVMIQIALDPNQIRVDGLPYATARPSHPGVILSFQSKHGPLSYPCDRYDRWEDNLRAIALSLEHLRDVDRYGVTKRGEQYRGWTLAPAANAPTMDKTAAVTVLQAYSETLIDSKDKARDAYKAAVMKTHPDRGGDAEAFKAVQQAAEALGL